MNYEDFDDSMIVSASTHVPGKGTPVSSRRQNISLPGEYQRPLNWAHMDAGGGNVRRALACADIRKAVLEAKEIDRAYPGMTEPVVDG